MNSWEVIQGDALSVLRTMPTASVHCIITSPPYWGLRNYKVDGQYGAELTVAEYVDNMRCVFREARRVLRPDGTLWLNLGDSYIGSGRGAGSKYEKIGSTGRLGLSPDNVPQGNMKPKDKAGVPWRVAFALQDDGWYLRSDIIWSKPNAMPESVKDRPVSSHEYIFLMSPSPKYYYDWYSISEASAESSLKRYTYGFSDIDPDIGYRMQRKNGGWPGIGRKHSDARDRGEPDSMQALNIRSKRDVWNVSTKGFKGAHFAVFPTDLIKPCVLAGTSEYGVCKECGAPWEREVNRTIVGDLVEVPYSGNGQLRSNGSEGMNGQYGTTLNQGHKVQHEGINWNPTCDCGSDVKPAVVMDMFSGSGTTGVVALDNGRDYIGIELNPEYIKLSDSRLQNTAPLFQWAGDV